MLKERISGISDKAWEEELAYLVKALPDIGYVKAFVIGKSSMRADEHCTRRKVLYLN